MRAIILAAGRGSRLQQAADGQLPKCLLTFGRRSLLERHLQLLQAAGVEEIVLALGFRHEGTLRERFWFAGRVYDELNFGLLRADWEQRTSPQPTR